MDNTLELLLRTAHTGDQALALAGADLACQEVINRQYASGTTGFPRGVMLTHHTRTTASTSASGSGSSRPSGSA